MSANRAAQRMRTPEGPVVASMPDLSTAWTRRRHIRSDQSPSSDIYWQHYTSSLMILPEAAVPTSSPTVHRTPRPNHLPGPRVGVLRGSAATVLRGSAATVLCGALGLALGATAARTTASSTGPIGLDVLVVALALGLGAAAAAPSPSARAATSTSRPIGPVLLAVVRAAVAPRARPRAPQSTVAADPRSTVAADPRSTPTRGPGRWFGLGVRCTVGDDVGTAASGRIIRDDV